MREDFYFNEIKSTREHAESVLLLTTTKNYNWNNADMCCGFLPTVTKREVQLSNPTDPTM